MRELLRPRWLAFHLLALLAALVMLRLSLWQWHRARTRDSLLNYSYTLEWVLFAVFTLVAYAKLARDEVLAKAMPGAPAQPLDPVPARPVAAAPAEDEDDELASYNRYLASLHAPREDSGR